MAEQEMDALDVCTIGSVENVGELIEVPPWRPLRRRRLDAMQRGAVESIGAASPADDDEDKMRTMVGLVGPTPQADLNESHLEINGANAMQSRMEEDGKEIEVVMVEFEFVEACVSNAEEALTVGVLQQIPAPSSKLTTAQKGKGWPLLRIRHCPCLNFMTLFIQSTGQVLHSVNTSGGHHPSMSIMATITN